MGLSDKEQRVLNETTERNIIRSKIKALDFRLLTCLNDERDEIEEEISRLRLELIKSYKSWKEWQIILYVETLTPL